MKENKMMKTKYWTSALLGMSVSLTSTAGLSEEHVVGQKDKAFTVEKLVIKVGDTVSFRNDDPFFHNVFSISGNKVFDLGSYPAGEARSVKFTEAGVVEVECAIHSNMYLEIEVQ